jgi:hypothetical protein
MAEKIYIQVDDTVREATPQEAAAILEGQEESASENS